jgi:hypothetical protein
MRVPGLVILVAIASCAFGFGSIASAEKVKTNQEAKLLNHPGEQGAVLLHLKEGQTMTLLSEEGRWLKVRVQGRTGFVPRSKVDMPDNAEIARNTRRRPFVDGRSTHRGFDSGAGPDDRVGADATGDIATKDTGDDDDSSKKPVVKKPAKSKGDDDDDDDSGKKPAVKKPTPVAAKSKSKGDDDDDDDDSGKKPAVKKPAPAAKPAAKGKSKGDDDDDDDDSGKKSKPAAKKPVTVATKPAAKGKSKGDDDDDDDDNGKKSKAKSKGDDDDDSKDADSDKRAHAHVEAKSKVYDERNKTSSVAFVAKPGDKLYVDSTKGDWTTVENDDGDAGWILSSDLLVDDNSSGGGAGRKLTINTAGGLGATLIQQGMRTAGSTLSGASEVPDKYNISASAATLSIGGDLYYPVGKKLFIGGELTYDGSKTVGGGIVYMGVDTGFTIHDINLRAVGAYDFQRPSGMMLLAHLGFRYRAYLVDNYSSVAENPAKIPQEILKAPTIGATLALPNLGPSYGLAFGFDAILFGSSIQQTAGYEDGSTPSVIDLELSGQFLYRLKQDLNLLATFRFEYGDYSFGTPPADSMRGHTPTGNVSRTDNLDTLTVGVAYAF